MEMIDVGESTGALPQMLNSVAEFFEEDVQTALTAALALIEPAILIVMGSVVVVILIALYLPIFSLGQASTWEATKASLSSTEPRSYLWLTAPYLSPRLYRNQTRTTRAQMLAQRYRCEFVDLKNFRIQHDLFRTVPVDMMFRYNFVPLEQMEDRLIIAVSDPSRLMMLDEIAGLLGQRLITRVATLSQITDLLKKPSSRSAFSTKPPKASRSTSHRRRQPRRKPLDREAHVAKTTSAPIIQLVDTTIFTALERRASRHPHRNPRRLSCWSSTASTACCSTPWRRSRASTTQTIISRIKVMSELDIAERRVPQDGRFRVRYKGRLIDFRVSIMPTVHGENAVLRVLDKESMSEKFRKLSLDVVGFGEDDLRRFRRYIKEPYGMVLVTGPTGSGKTTTLYAALNEIKNDEDKIITIEDPVEYQIRGITQIPVNEKKGLTFARGLRSILRHDPDKILVGEIRDQETAQIAINSALTGHLVFTTVHANNVVDVLGRFLNMGVEAYNFVSALNCILAQRLVRIICEHCNQPVTTTTSSCVDSGLDPDEWRDFDFYEGAGCIECGGTGFRGRTAIHELLDLTDRSAK